MILPPAACPGAVWIYMSAIPASSANVLAAVNRLGGKTAFIGKVGDDMHGAFLRETLEKAEIDTTGLITDEKYFTTLAFVSLKNGERDFSFARKPGADTQITKEEVNLELLKETRIFHCGSLSLTDEPAREATYYAVEQAKKAGAVISYDPNYRAPLWPMWRRRRGRCGIWCPGRTL